MWRTTKPTASSTVARPIPAEKRARPGRWRIRWIVAGLLVAAAGPARCGYDPAPLLRELASPAYEGRRSGEAGAERAAKRLAALCDSLGLPTPSEGRLQPFAFARAVTHADSSLSIDGAPVFDGWRLLDASASGAVESEALFCGYGIVQEGAGWDDWRGLDGAGRVALIVRQGPRGERPDDPAWVRAYALDERIARARSAGAGAVILLDNPFGAGQGPSADGPDWRLTSAGMPLLAASVELGDRLLGGPGALKARLSRLNRSKRPDPTTATLGRLRVVAAVERDEAPGWNVLARIPGRGVAARETVLLGAHYDHLGHGSDGRGPLHPGADDNASGASTALAVASDLRAHPPGPEGRRSFELALFGGEELGLLGSRAWLAGREDPPVLMVNFDMLGRLRGGELHLLGGEDHPLTAAPLRERAAAAGLSVVASRDVPGGGDHVAFRRAGLPAAMAFTGPHEDYHRPGDTVDRIDFDGLARLRPVLSGWLADLLDPRRELDAPGARLAETAGGEGGPVRVAIGIVPGYESEGGGLPVKSVRAGSPAEVAGIREGDRIAALGRFPVANIFDYTFAIRHFEAGDSVPVVLLRGEARLSVVVTLGDRIR